MFSHIGRTSLFSRQSLLCALLFGLCLLLIWPVAAIGIDDDWVYCITALDFARTGHLLFHGWASPILGWQALWGALCIKLFGWSFTCLRLSMVPIALATVLLYRAILRRFGLNDAHASFGTLALALSPLFIPLSVTFMTDVSCLFAILVCLYLCQLAIASPTARGAILWLCAAALTNIVLGTVRQAAWLGVLLIVPSCGWLLRRRRGAPSATIALWLVSIVCIWACLHWFARQPYTAPERLIPGPINRHVLRHLVGQATKTALDIVLFSLPVLAVAFSALAAFRRHSRLRLIAAFVLFGLLCMVLHVLGRLRRFEPPWMGNVVSAKGIMQSGGLFGSTRTAAEPVLLILLALFVICLCIFAEALWITRHEPTSRWPENSMPSWYTLSLLLLPFLAGYCLLLLPRSGFIGSNDRYELEVLAVLFVFVLRWHQERFGERLPIFAAVILAIFAIIAVAATHDLFAMDRARVQLADEMQSAGVPRTEIRGGFEFDAMTQVDAWGYVNDWRIANPPGAYHPEPIRYGPCNYWFQPMTPAVHARYAIAADPTPCLGPSSFAPVGYHTWLPPATRQLIAGTVLPMDTTGSVGR
jgi:hypothetical protein